MGEGERQEGREGGKRQEKSKLSCQPWNFFILVSTLHIGPEPCHVSSPRWQANQRRLASAHGRIRVEGAVTGHVNGRKASSWAAAPVALTLASVRSNGCLIAPSVKIIAPRPSTWQLATAICLTRSTQALHPRSAP